MAAQVAGATGLVTVSTRAIDWVREKARYRHEADFARELLGLHQRAQVAYRHDSRHILFAGTEQLHPDNLYGLTAASGNDYRRAEAANLVNVAESVSAQMNQNLVLIGSTTAEGLSRLIFGYRQDEDDADSLTIDDPPLDLPFQ